MVTTVINIRMDSRLIQYILCSLLLLGFTESKAQHIPEAYQQLDQLISSDPQAALDQLAAIEVNDSDPFQAAIHQFTLSRAFISLAYPDKALEAANLAISLLPQNRPDDLYYRIMMTQTQAMEISGLAAEALPLAKQAVVWAEQADDLEMLIDALLGLGYIENNLGNSVGALSAFLRAYNTAPDTGITNSKSAVASSVALVYEYRKEFELAIPYFQESVNYQRKENNLLELSISLYGLGRANKHIGKTNLGQSQLQESLEISRQIGDDQGVAYALKELAPIKIGDNQLEQAADMLAEAIALFEQSQNHFMLLDVYKTMAVLQLKKGDLQAAQDNLNLAREHVDETRMPSQAFALDEVETMIMASQGDHAAAYKTLKEVMYNKQKMLTRQSTRQLHELRTQYELENKEKTNLMLAQENENQKLLLLQEEQQNKILLISLITASLMTTILILAALQNRKQKRKLFQLANYDPLTQLPNRSHTLEKLSTKQIQLNPKEGMLIAMIDLDHFKQVNDQLGHEAGDEVLKQMGELCRELIHPPHFVGRLGGEEFLLALFKTNLTEAETLIDQMRDKYQSLFKDLLAECDNNRMKMGFSAGISRCHRNDPLKECIKAADMAMYEAKNTGRNRTLNA